MKAVASLGLALFIVALAAAEDKKAGLDPAKLVGDWTYASGMKSGEKVEKERLAGVIKITKETLTLPAPEGMKPFVIGYKLDAKASPATIDLDIKDGPVQEGKAEGIIALDGDELKLCYAPAPGKRPTKFESTAANGAFYFVLKRKK